MKEDVKKLIDELVDEIDDCTQDSLDFSQSAHTTNLCLFGKRDSRYLKGVAAKAKKFWVPVRWFDCPPPLRPDEPFLVDLESFKGENLILNPDDEEMDLDCVYYGDRLSCTAEACLDILKRATTLSGKHVCIIGRGHAVQMLRDALLHGYDATVTICHSKTKELREIVATADIVINSAPRLNPYRDVGFKVDRILLDISGALCDWEDSNLLTYIGPREIGRVNTAIVLNRFAGVI